MISIKLLIVDDAIFMRRLLSNIIKEDEKYCIVGEAGDGFEAIEQVKKLSPDIVTLDITMPNMDGLTALKEIIKISPTTKVIMVSAMGQQPIVIDAIKLGAKDFISKPFDKERVLQALQNVSK